MNTLRDTDREKFRKDFSVAFMCDFVSAGSSVGHDPRNHVGYDCGVNPPRVYQRWSDYHIGIMQG